MKILCMAVVTTILGLSATAVTAVAQSKTEAGSGDMSQAEIGRKSGRCPGGEIRFFVRGCSGV